MPSSSFAEVDVKVGVEVEVEVKVGVEVEVKVGVGVEVEVDATLSVDGIQILFWVGGLAT